MDEKLVHALETDYTRAPIAPEERVMLDYVVQLTKDATKISPADHVRLRQAGFDDKAILQITLIASGSITSTGWPTRSGWEEKDDAAPASGGTCANRLRHIPAAHVLSSEGETRSMLMTQDRASSEGLNESDRHYYGWRVVLAACFGVMVGFGSLFVYTFSVFVKPLGAEFGWSREGISRGFGFAALSMAFCSPALGRLLDRYGPRRIILPCLAIYGCAVAAMAFLSPHLWQFYATCILMGAVGNGAAHLAYSRSISSWFSQRLGMALAFVMAGAGLGSMILPFLAQSIISRAGWRAAYLSLGGLALAVGLPLTWRFVHERGTTEHSSASVSHSGLTWQQGVRSFQFWIIVSVLFVSSVAMNGTVTQLAALLTDRGVTPGGAALCASTLGGSSLAGRVVIGWVLDRFFGARVAFVVFLITAAGIFLLARADTLLMGSIAAGLIGVGAGGEADITPYLLTRYFGLRAFATLYGFTWTFYAIAGAIGPVIMGRAFDSTGSYTSLLTWLALATALAGTLMLLLPRYSKLAEAGAASDAVVFAE